jgi:hypothetical protein
MIPYNQQFGQHSPYRDLPEDEEERQRQSVAAAIAPAPQAPQQPQMKPGAPQVDPSAPQRASLQMSAIGGGAPRNAPRADGSLGSMAMGGAAGAALGGMFGGGGGGPRRGTVRQDPQGTPGLHANALPGLMPPGLQAPQQEPLARHNDGSLASMGTGGTGYNPEVERIRQAMGLQEGQKLPAPAAPAAASNPAWNTDGFVAPAQIAQNFAAQAPAGWDQKKWSDPNHQTPKYVWGRITQDDNPNDIEQMLAAYPGAQFDGKDKITGIPGLGAIDVYQGASVGANVPQWLDLAAEQRGAGADPVQLALGASSPEEEALAQSLGIDTSNPLWRQIFEELQAEALGIPSGANADPRFRY